MQGEKELVERAKTEEAAFGELFDHYYHPIYSYIARRLGDAAAAQDLAAETFIKAYQHLEKFSWRGVSFGNWLYTIAGNEVKMYYRKQQRAPLSLCKLFDEEGYEPASDTNLQQELTDVQDALERQQSFARALAVLQQLPIKYQEVITLRFTEKKKLHEIAAIIGKKEGTVKSLLSRGLAKLRAELAAAETAVQPNAGLRITLSEGQLITQPHESYED